MVSLLETRAFSPCSRGADTVRRCVSLNQSCVQRTGSVSTVVTITLCHLPTLSTSHTNTIAWI
eukprot:m.76774 g.76774  ORF g.76774 m.76774 type:complete len:63 (+) comp9087_c0_seq3:1184-1372(+)